MTANNLKLGVDVTSAHNLMAKDGQGSSSSYVELCFDGQRYRTTVKDKDLNPVWDESFYFNVSDPLNLQHLSLDVYVYSTLRGANIRSFLGKVSISGTSFVPRSDSVVLHYPLEKRGIFSRVRGEIGLKVYITDDPSIKSSTPVPATNPDPTTLDSHSFRHLPNPNNTSHHDHEAKHHSNKYEVEEMRAEAPPPRIVRVVKARELPTMDITGSLDQFVEVRVGNYRGVTRHVDKNHDPEWNVVFAFSKERMQASVLDVVVKDKDLIKD